MASKLGKTPTSIHEYAQQVYNEINPNGSASVSPIGESLQQTKSSNIKDYGEFTVLVPIEFTGTLESFDKEGTPKWIPKVNNKIGEHISTDIYSGSDGNKYRRILVKAEIVNFRNTLPYSVGVKFSGIPSTSSVFGVDKDVDYPMFGETSGTVSERLHLNEWNEEGMARLSDAGWNTFTADDITKSVIEKTTVGWKLKNGSPITDFGIQRKEINKDNAFQIQNEKTNEKIFCISANLAQKLHDELIQEYERLPFHDPKGITATIHRLDGKEWSNTKVGIGNSYNHPGLNPKTTTETVAVGLKLTYQNWKVSN